MIKITGTALVAVALLSAGSAMAGEKGGACCAKTASNKQACANLATLGVNADQKSKLEAWQADCMKAGCTKDSMAKFMKQAKGILTAEQYAKLKAECDKTMGGEKTRA
ncbi:MAG: hypothetical protein ABJB69_02470 [Spartobacteria bacterium]